MLLLVAARQTQILGRSPPGLLEESVQQHHPPELVDVEQNPRNPIPREVSPDLADSTFQMPARRHPERPAVLDVIMSCPTRLRSSAESVVLSQSRTGSPPPSVRKKIAGTCFFGLSDTIAVYHGWYDGGREYRAPELCRGIHLVHLHAGAHRPEHFQRDGRALRLQREMRASAARHASRGRIRLTERSAGGGVTL